MSESIIDSLKRLCIHATPGPWWALKDAHCRQAIPGMQEENFDPVGQWTIVSGDDPGYPDTIIAVIDPAPCTRDNDAEFIAKARMTIPALMDQVERLDAENRALREQMKQARARLEVGP